MSVLNLFKTKDLESFLKEFNKEKILTLSWISNLSAKAFLLSFFREKLKDENFFWITNTNEEAIEIWKDLQLFVWSKPIHPIIWEINEWDRVRIINLINTSSWNIFILPKSKINDEFASFEKIKENSFSVEKWKEIDILWFFHFLSNGDYELSLDARLEKWMYRRNGAMIDIFPSHSSWAFKIELDWDEIAWIYKYDQDLKKVKWEVDLLEVFQNKLWIKRNKFTDNIRKQDVVLFDELDLRKPWEITDFAMLYSKRIIDFNLFPDDWKEFHHLRYLSVLKFYNAQDLITDLRTKIEDKWQIITCTKRTKELQNIFDEYKIPYFKPIKTSAKKIKVPKWIWVIILEIWDDDFLPHSFQNPDFKQLFLSEKEIFTIQKSKRNQSVKKLSLDFITSLKPKDFVVHFDHWIWHFEWIIKKDIDWITREYLEIFYHWSDKIFVPIDQVDKISKYLTWDEWEDPRLSKLWSIWWKNVQKRVKEESRKIAKELLDLYAKRTQSKRPAFFKDTEDQEKFEKAFPYEPTPGQLKAISDVKADMEKDSPMDRLVVWDVWFWKTEIAMRAAFKATESWKQVVIIAPVTILAVQHYESFKKRMSWFWKRVESLTRFQTWAEQKNIIERVRKGDVDILIWTHRLLSNDINFFNLWLVVIDEEQKFWVKQKEKLKEVRANVDVLTMTATPIPRTLNMWLNKLRDITTITTPPQWRLPVVSEVRKYNDSLVRLAIMKELERWWQTYFLHNRVETIEWIAEKLRILVPEAKFVVAHWQLSPHDLEERIMAFKKWEYDVLISSTIIENWIDLANANTMIVNNAERFWLSQLYQLRWRIWRSKRQAYAYFLYYVQWVSVDAKKRLRAIVEASELWAWFQIAMKDLEIRWAWDILWAKQSWAVSSIWVSHFLRVLEKTVEELRMWWNLQWVDEESLEATTIDLPIDWFVPDTYIPDPNEKMSTYQKFSAVMNKEVLDEILEDLHEEYWHLPVQVRNLEKLILLKIDATKALIKKIFSRAVPWWKEIVFLLSSNCKPESIFKAIDINENWEIRWDSIAIKMKKLPPLWLKEIHKTATVMIPEKKKVLKWKEKRKLKKKKK